MADCHRSASPTACKSRSGFNSADGATIQPPLTIQDESRKAIEVHGGLSCEIVSDLCPNPFSHDWHVQPSCQRPNRLPPERRAFRSRRIRFLGGKPNKSRSGCPRNPTNISSARNPVNLHIPQHLHMISTCEIWLDLCYWGAKRSSLQRATVWPSALDIETRPFSGARRSGRHKIEKRSYFGGPCFEGTL